MKLFNRMPAHIVACYLGLADRDGKAITIKPPTLRADKALCGYKAGKGAYTNKKGVQLFEDCILVEGLTEMDILTILNSTNQECALVSDSHGNHSFLDENGIKTPAGKMVMLTHAPKTGDYSQFGDYYYQLVA